MNKFTFGKTPAAVYLYEYLQANKNQIVLKRVGKALTSNRNLLSQIEKANLSGAINAHNVARIINNIRSGFFVDVGDELASNLTTNITNLRRPFGSSVKIGGYLVLFAHFATQI